MKMQGFQLILKCLLLTVIEILHATEKKKKTENNHVLLQNDVHNSHPSS